MEGLGKKVKVEQMAVGTDKKFFLGCDPTQGSMVKTNSVQNVALIAER